MRKPIVVGVAAVAAASLASASWAGGAEAGDGADDHRQHAELMARAVLPAQSYRAGSEPSGAALAADPVNGVTPPLPGQPIQGWSAILPDGDGSYLVMSDNGFGSKENSADFLLRVHRVEPELAAGTIRVADGGFGLSDPEGHIGWPVTRPDRQLTGADFDLESMQRLDDGTFWFGEEFGPFLLHTDAEGRLLEPPVPLPHVRSPQNPTLGGAEPNLARSKGFEGMGLASDGRHLYPMLEGPIAGDDAQDLRIYEFDTATSQYTDRQWRFRLEHPTDAIGDLIAVDDDRLIVIERDPRQGPEARLKALYLLDRRDRDDDGYVDKTLLLNLMAVPDPGEVGGDGPFFRFPFETIENVAIVDDHTLVVANDNNYPFSAGRTAGQPDDNELILIRFDQPLEAAGRFLTGGNR